MRSKLSATTLLFTDRVRLEPGVRVLLLNCDDAALARWTVESAAPGGEVIALHSSYRALRDLARIEGLRVDETVYPAPDAHGPADAALLTLPKGREAARAWLWTAAQTLRPGGTLYLAGPKAGGAKSAIKDAGALFGEAAVLGYKGGHRIAAAIRPEALTFPEDWAETRPWAPREIAIERPGRSIPVVTMPGVFSWDHLDEGTALLLDHLEAAPDARALDIGCGYGIIGAVLAHEGARVTLVDDDLLAVRCARLTVARNGLDDRCTVLPSDVTEAVAGQTFDHVVSNPPFHQGIDVTTATAERFMREAHAVLRPGGRLTIVANRFLPYDRVMAAAFGDVQMLAETPSFYVLEAVRAGR